MTQHYTFGEGKKLQSEINNKLKYWRANKLLFLILQRLLKLKLPMYSFNNIYTRKCDLHTSKYFSSSLIFSTTIRIISKNLKKIFTKISKNFLIFSTTISSINYYFFVSQNIVLIESGTANDNPSVMLSNTVLFNSNCYYN